jgi:hypothetical protein
MSHALGEFVGPLAGLVSLARPRFDEAFVLSGRLMVAV